ncbi:outer membrane protein [Bradyrhizobium prioriisuperbiae]|uniref:outer membrane protein n=1 Tax=Bradyrhizobium prioriisuperbiae TaxID=2854389 RepID=UPI0028F079BA|nr:outer membrane beta-barrel protein [Bradyrhizobium prioritasuperba]
MRKFLITAAALAISTGAASAADLAARPYTKAPPPVLDPIYNWTGFYIGGNGGYGWSRVEHEDLIPGFGGFWTSGTMNPLGPTQTLKPQGAVYGGQMGYNWQAANWVFGLEGQFNGADLKRTDTSLFFPTTDLVRAKIDTFATVTGRIGYAFNNWLPYIKGGYAGANLKTTNFDIFGTRLINETWRSGYVIGAGVEVGFATNWSVAVEYNYMDFGSKSFSGVNTTSTGTTFGTERFSDDLRISTITGRINYRFGGPVVARY